jgi:hypothetical protein
MAFDSNSLYSRAAEHNRRYAEHNGYDFFTFPIPNSTVAPHFARYTRFLSLLEDNSWEFVVYLDADSVVLNQDGHLPVPPPGIDVIFGNEQASMNSRSRFLRWAQGYPLNSGFIAMRSGTFAKNFAADLVSNTLCDECRLSGCENYKFFDQGCIHRLLKAKPDWRSQVGVLAAVQTSMPSDEPDRLLFHDFGGRKRDGNAKLRRYLDRSSAHNRSMIEHEHEHAWQRGEGGNMRGHLRRGGTGELAFAL